MKVINSNNVPKPKGIKMTKQDLKKLESSTATAVADMKAFVSSKDFNLQDKTKASCFVRSAFGDAQSALIKLRKAITTL